MSEDQEKIKTESWAETIEDTKTQLAEMYLNFLDKQKWWLMATWASLGVNLNPLQKDAVEYLTSEAAEEEDILSKIGKNIKEKLIEKVTEWTFLEYNKANLTKMKSLIMQYKGDQAKLQELMKQIEEGKDPTAESLPNIAPTEQQQSLQQQKSEEPPLAENNWTVLPSEELTPNVPVPPAVIAGAAVVWAGVVAVEKVDKLTYNEPLKGRDVKITSEFGKRTNPITWEPWQMHYGIDIAMPKKTPIHSIVSGKVIENARDKKWWGNYIVIEWDDGRKYSYLHLNNRSDLQIDTIVKTGDVIGKVGSTWKSTWPHLHLTIKENDKPVDPLAALPQVFENYTMA